MKPYKKNKNGDLVYRFQIQIDGIKHTKYVNYSYTPKKTDLTIIKSNWIQSLRESTNKNIKKNSAIELFNKYLSQKQEYSKKHKYNIEKVKLFLINYKNISYIRKADCIKFFNKINNGQRKDTTAKRIFCALSAFLSWCAKMDYIEYNPALRLNLGVKENKRTGSLTHDQKLEVLEKSKPLPHLHLAILIAMMTGLRKGEILSLQWAWIDFKNETLRIPHENTKNKKGFFIKLSPKLLDILKEVKNNRDYESTHIVEYKDKPIKDNIKRSFNTLRKHLSFEYIGNGERFTFHHLRHTFATELAQSGLPLVEVKNALNHSDIQTTLRYAHSTGKGVVEAIDKINEGLV